MKKSNAPAGARTPFQKWVDKYQGLFYLIPWIIGFVVFKAIPFGQSLYYSFTDMDFFNGIHQYGIMNYVDVIWDNLIPFLTVCVVSMIVTYGVTVWVVKLTMKLMNKEENT